MLENLSKEEKKVILKKLVNELINKNLTQWENDFLNSVKRQIKKKELTEKQIKVLEKLRKKYVK